MNPQEKFPGVPEGSNDALALMAAETLNRELNVPLDHGVVIRVTKEEETYFVREWIASDRTESKEAECISVAQIARDGDRWMVMSFGSDAEWKDLGNRYAGTFDHCLAMIIEDPEYHFWG